MKIAPWQGCAVLVATLAWHSPSPAQIYHCTIQHANHRETIFSGTPCGENAETIIVRENLPAGQNQSVDPDYVLERQKASVTLWALAEKGRVAVGMNERQVRRAWGRPTTINYGNSNRGQFDQWVYRSKGKSISASYVYFSDGTVTSYDINKPKASGR